MERNINDELLQFPKRIRSDRRSSTSMASLQPPTTMEKLPNNVLSHIFIRLLAKQLAQMRSVNKSWNALLSNKSFIISHLHHSIQNNEEVVLFFYHESGDFAEPFSAHPSRSPDLKIPNFIKTPANLISVIGSVNGLICSSYASYDHPCNLQIWNPSLSAVLTLPPYALPSPSGNYFSPVMRRNMNIRFGFDPKADDYKVVKLPSLSGPASFFHPREAHYYNTELFGVKEWMQVEVYSMRKASWKLITQTFPSHITCIVSAQRDVCVDGLILWLCYIGEDRSGQTIVAFDLGAETFHETPLPDSILKHGTCTRSNVLGILAGKLCVMSYAKGGEFEVWVMDEYGVVESWIKNHAFSQFCNIVPWGFTLRNKFLIEKLDGDDDGFFPFGLYDPVAAKTKYFKVRVGITKIYVGYVDSLVWVAPDKREMVKCRGSDVHHR